MPMELEWHDGDNYPTTGVIVERRQLLSDALLVHTPQGWVGYRDVAEVDGRSVRRGANECRSSFSRETRIVMINCDGLPTEIFPLATPA